MRRKKSSIVWIQGITCNGDSHSFYNYESMKSFSKDFEMLYHPLLLLKKSFQEIIEGEDAFDFLIIEGALSKDKSIIERFGYGMEDIVDALSKRAKHIICAGSCACYGGVFRLRDEKSIFGLLFSGKQKGGYWKDSSNVINLSGCPVHPSWIVDTLYALKENKKVITDEFLRPKEIYAYLAHHGCIRNEYFEWKVDCKGFGHKEGCLFYEQGCLGPMTHANCNKILWNNVSSKTRVGSPCVGCTEFDFPRKSLYETQTNMSLPQAPVGISKRAYYALAGVAKGFKIERLEKRLFDEDN
ncbi:MAG: hydrogenase [Sulfurospirillaceae bacterium]|nr:hydrogenase [Sulfurospirillaceae bacterium]